jgi:transposase
MDGILPYVRVSIKERMLRRLRELTDAKERNRYLIILNLIKGRAAAEVAKVLHVARSTVYRVATRFSEFGEAGLVDRREDNGRRKVDEEYLSKLWKTVRSHADEHGWPRPTWTREMLIQTLHKLTRVRIGLSTMSRALATIDARRGKPKPTVQCPWSPERKNRRLAKIRKLLQRLPASEVALYEDEVDVHLNPKIGLDWMVRGEQKEVPTPGKNEKRYLAGAQDVRTGRLHWVEGEKKTSELFIRLLWNLINAYPNAKVIHLVLDNYGIHKSAQAILAVRSCRGRIRLHFLPPYCPDHNKIERTWQDLHANVTRNHRCQTMSELMQNVRAYLRRRNTDKERSMSTRRAA